MYKKEFFCYSCGRFEVIMMSIGPGEYMRLPMPAQGITSIPVDLNIAPSVSTWAGMLLFDDQMVGPKDLDKLSEDELAILASWVQTMVQPDRFFTVAELPSDELSQDPQAAAMLDHRKRPRLGSGLPWIIPTTILHHCPQWAGLQRLVRLLPPGILELRQHDGQRWFLCGAR